MKKLLSITALAAILTSSAFAGQIVINATVQAAAQVAFGTPPVNALNAGTFEFEGANFNLGNLALGTTSSSTQGVYVKTNSATGIKISLVDASGNNGELIGANGVPNIPTTFALNSGATPLTVGGTPANIVLGPDAGTVAVTDITLSATPVSNQISGSYTSNIDVIVAAI